MGSTSKRARLTYNPNYGQPHKKGKASTELLKQLRRLTDRIAKEGDTKWLRNAMDVLAKRLKKAGLSGKVPSATAAKPAKAAPAKKKAPAKQKEA